jgi:hypothetical protein
MQQLLDEHENSSKDNLNVEPGCMNTNTIEYDDSESKLTISLITHVYRDSCVLLIKVTLLLQSNSD